MQRHGLFTAVAVTIGIALGACSIPDTAFHATAGDDAGGGDDQVAAPSLIASLDGPLSIDEGGTATISIHLSTPPAGDLVVAAVLGAGPVTVSPAMAVFSPTNFDADQAFKLTSVPDANAISEEQSLTFRATGVADKALTVKSIDNGVQNIKVTPANATIKEQTTTADLSVSLTQQPSANVTVLITSKTGKAHPSTGQLTFTHDNYATAQTVTIDGVDDADTVDSSDVIQLRATDPDSATPLSRDVPITIIDNDLALTSYGWPAPPAFASSFSMLQGQVIAYKVTLTAAATLTTFGVFVPTAAADFRMALYADNGNTPGALISGAQFLRRTLANGANTVTIGDVALVSNSYWIALRIGSPTTLSAGDAGQTGVRCTRQLNISSLDDAWPVNFGASDCANTNLFNVWIITHP